MSTFSADWTDDGLLRINSGDGKSSRSRPRLYSVDVQPSDIGYQFLLNKRIKFPSGKIGFDLERIVTVRHDGAFASCTCKGGEFHKRSGKTECVHEKAVPLLLQRMKEKKENSMDTATKTEAEFTVRDAPPADQSAIAEVKKPKKAETAAANMKLAGALAGAQQKCKPAAKDSTNSYHKYRYASAEAIIEAAKDALADTGLSLVPVGQALNGHATAGENRFELERKFLLLHTSGESIPIVVCWPVCPEKGRPLDKATAIAATSSLAYLLRDLLLMPRVDAADDLPGSGPATQEQPTSQATPALAAIAAALAPAMEPNSIHSHEYLRAQATKEAYTLASSIKPDLFYATLKKKYNVERIDDLDDNQRDELIVKLRAASKKG